MSVPMIEDKRIAIRSVDNEKSTIRSSSELRDHVNNCRKLEAARNFRNELHTFGDMRTTSRFLYSFMCHWKEELFTPSYRATELLNCVIDSINCLG